MPYNQRSELEINYIWVGGNPMPTSYLQNMLHMINVSPGIDMNIWVDAETYPVLCAQIKETKLYDGKKFKNTHKNLRFIEISERELGVPKEIIPLLINTKKAKIWAGYSDILRLFILSRPKEAEKLDRHARFYLESDNMVFTLAFNFFKDRNIAALYDEKSAENQIKWIPEIIRGDMLYLDIDSEDGSNFSQNLAMHMKNLLTDDLMCELFKALLAESIKNEGFACEDIMASYGMLVQAIFRMQFMHEDSAQIYGLKPFIIDEGSLKGTIMPGGIKLSSTTKERSWESDKKVAPIENSLLYHLFFTRIFQLSKIPESAANMLQHLGHTSIEDFFNDCSQKWSNTEGWQGEVSLQLRKLVSAARNSDTSRFQCKKSLKA